MLNQIVQAANENNPLIPTGREATATIIGLVQIALVLYAIFTIYRAPRIGAGVKLLWLLTVLVLPLLGGISWIFYYRHLKFMHSHS